MSGVTVLAGTDVRFECRYRRAQAGMTMVEVLVTLLVISIGLLGVAALHSLSLRNNYDALMRSHASALASDIADRMRANRDAVADYQVPLGPPPALDDDSTQRDVDISEWKATVAEQLPNGDASIAFAPATSIVTIQIQWGERGSAMQAQQTMSFVTETEI